jgi:glycosyltransferase involved in cell wall biosynthesis
MNILKTISYNATCFSTNYSGANQRFFTLYKKLIKKLHNINFIIYEPSDYSLKSNFKGIKNIKFVKTLTAADGSRWHKFFTLTLTIKLFFSRNFDLGEIFNLPFFNVFKKKIIFTVHDLRYHNFQNNTLISFLYRIIFFLSLKNIKYIIVVSNTIKNELKKIFPKKKIFVIYNSIDFLFKEYQQVKKQLLQKLLLPKKYLLSIGHIESRKNYLNLLKAFKLFSDKNIDYSLIIVGFTYEKKTKDLLSQFIKTNNLSAQVQILSNINEQEKFDLYKNAQLFIFPSLYEGFGIPILEAMRARCPFVLSNIPVFKEITENRLFYFNPHSPNSIRKTIETVLFSERKKTYLIRYGSKRYRYFSTEKNVKKLADLYSTII